MRTEVCEAGFAQHLDGVFLRVAVEVAQQEYVVVSGRGAQAIGESGQRGRLTLAVAVPLTLTVTTVDVVAGRSAGALGLQVVGDDREHVAVLGEGLRDRLAGVEEDGFVDEAD